MRKSPSSFHAVLLALALASGVAAFAPRALAAAAPRQSNAPDKAYLNGYNSGYTSGQQDRQAAHAANAHKFKTYQEATDGYTAAYGTRDQYRTAFQSGFEDGYNDGFADRPESIGPGTAPPPPPPPDAAAPNLPVYNANVPPPPGASPGTDPASVARANGYREGYNAGKYDADRSAAANPTGGAEYNEAEIGYTRDLGALNEYEKNFRDGFSTGYADGFAHRLYNSSIGARLADGPPDSVTPPALVTPVTAATAPTPAPPPPAAVTIPPGTVIQAVLNDNISSKTSKVGDAFSASVTVPVWVGSTQIIPAGSTISGTLAKVQKAGKMSGQAELQLQYNTIQIPGNTPVQLTATTSGVGGNGSTNNEGTVNGQNPDGGKRVGTDSAIGAGVGGIFGGVGGLLRGAIAGAAVGTAGVLTSKSKDIVLKSGENISLKLDQPLQVQPIAGSAAH